MIGLGRLSKDKQVRASLAFLINLISRCVIGMPIIRSPPSIPLFSLRDQNLSYMGQVAQHGTIACPIYALTGRSFRAGKNISLRVYINPRIISFRRCNSKKYFILTAFRN